MCWPPATTSTSRGGSAARFVAVIEGPGTGATVEATIECAGAACSGCCFALAGRVAGAAPLVTSWSGAVSLGAGWSELSSAISVEEGNQKSRSFTTTTMRAASNRPRAINIWRRCFSCDPASSGPLRLSTPVFCSSIGMMQFLPGHPQAPSLVCLEIPADASRSRVSLQNSNCPHSIKFLLGGRYRASDSSLRQ